jgi:hypothetical protein
MPFRRAAAFSLTIQREKTTVSKHSDQWSCFRKDAADAVRGNAVTREGCKRGVGVVRGDGDQETAGGLWIEEEVLIFGRDAWSESGALADEGAIVF